MNIKLFFTLSLLVAVLTQTLPKQTPVIGIYTQTNDEDKLTTFESYIASSYIKFIEMSGAQVVPIFAFSSQSEIAALLPKINGVLFPGGDEPIDITQRWTLNAKFILEWAIKENDAGRVFPVWGTCLGYETLAFLTSGNNNNMSTLSPVRGEVDVLNTMKFISSDKGYVLGDMSDRLISKLTTGQGVMYYNHHWIVSMDTYNSNKNLNTFWKVIT
jgi:gamma-glutamyl hydrolase